MCTRKHSEVASNETDYHTVQTVQTRDVQHTAETPSAPTPDYRNNRGLKLAPSYFKRELKNYSTLPVPLCAFTFSFPLDKGRGGRRFSTGLRVVDVCMWLLSLCLSLSLSPHLLGVCRDQHRRSALLCQRLGHGGHRRVRAVALRSRDPKVDGCQCKRKGKDKTTCLATTPTRRR